MNPLVVLYIEDSESDVAMFKESIKSAIEKNLIELHVVSDLTDAHMAGHCDVILLDLHLPSSIGVETVKRCRRGYPHKPIVVLTHIADAKMQAECIASGANYYFRKGDQSAEVVLRSMEAAIIGQLNRVAIQEEIDVTAKYIKKHEETLSLVQKRLQTLLERL